MKEAELPKNENDRVEALNQYNILDSLPESDFDDITRIAAEICESPIALVSFIDSDRQWFKSHYGLDTTETPRTYSFCAHAILDPKEVLLVPDSSQDERFSGNPLATGKPHVVFYAGAPLVNPEGHPLGTLCVIDNKPKELSQQQIGALKALANQVVGQLELRKKVREMKALTEKLQKANEALNRFAYSCSHDMKAPLANITMLTSMLQTEYGNNLDKRGQQCIGHLNDSAAKLRQLIDGVLSYSKIPEILLQGKDEVNVNQLLADIHDLIAIPENVTLKYQANLPVIKTYKIALQQILQNLISNAVKYNDKEHGLIEVELTESDGYWKFAVHDNGPGIAKEDQDKIFEVFQTLGLKDRFGNKGSGIGLSTVKKLVEELGGQITINSQEGEGTVFEFTLKK